MDSVVASSGLTRRTAIRLLLGSAVLPPVIGALGIPVAAATTPAAAGQPPLPDALRRLPLTDLAVEQVATIASDRHRVTFHRATWAGGHTYVRDLEIRTPAGAGCRSPRPSTGSMSSGSC